MGQVSKEFFEAFRQEILEKAGATAATANGLNISIRDDAEVEFAEREIERLNNELKTKNGEYESVRAEKAKLLKQIEELKTEQRAKQQEKTSLEQGLDTGDGTYSIDAMIRFANIHPEYAKAVKAIILHLTSNIDQPEIRQKIGSINIPAEPDESTKAIESIRQEIRDYVDKVRSEVKEPWRTYWLRLWNDIILADGIKDAILKPGSQVGTHFNRNLVANIICHLGKVNKGKMMGNRYNATNLARSLENNGKHSVRAQLGTMPDKKVAGIVDIIVENLRNEVTNRLETKL